MPVLSENLSLQGSHGKYLLEHLSLQGSHCKQLSKTHVGYEMTPKKTSSRNSMMVKLKEVQKSRRREPKWLRNQQNVGTILVAHDYRACKIWRFRSKQGCQELRQLILMPLVLPGEHAPATVGPQ